MGPRGGVVRSSTCRGVVMAPGQLGGVQCSPHGGHVSRPDQRGAGTVVVALAAVAVMLGAVMVLMVSTHVVALHRARAAADLSALAGAQAALSGGDGCRGARELAAAHQASVTVCRQNGGLGSVAVSVTARVELRWRIPGLPTTVSATAHAGTPP